MTQTEIDEALEGARWIVGAIDNNLVEHSSQDPFKIKLARALLDMNRQRKETEYNIEKAIELLESDYFENWEEATYVLRKCNLPRK